MGGRVGRWRGSVVSWCVMDWWWCCVVMMMKVTMVVVVVVDQWLLTAIIDSSLSITRISSVILPIRSPLVPDLVPDLLDCSVACERPEPTLSWPVAPAPHFGRVGSSNEIISSHTGCDEFLTTSVTPNL